VFTSPLTIDREHLPTTLVVQVQQLMRCVCVYVSGRDERNIFDIYLTCWPTVTLST